MTFCAPGHLGKKAVVFQGQLWFQTDSSQPTRLVQTEVGKLVGLEFVEIIVPPKKRLAFLNPVFFLRCELLILEYLVIFHVTLWCAYT